MADLKVEIFRISDIKPHPNADRMELAYIGAWQTCVPLNKFLKGDLVVYLPVDSIIPQDIENILFPPTAKVKLTKSRIRSIKLRGAMSQGMIELPETFGLDPNIKVGKDVAKKLGITKYQPPPAKVPGMMQGNPLKKRLRNPYFKKYTNISHFKYYPEALNGKMVAVTEKIHGTNFRAGYVPYNAYNWWRKIIRPILKPFGIMDYEFAFGSHNVELTPRGKYATTYYKDNVYSLTAKEYNLEALLEPGEVIYAEIYGHGIQKNYDYGCKDGEYKMVVIDVMIDGKYLSIGDASCFCQKKGLPFAPVLYAGIFSMDLMEKLVNPKGNKSILYPEMKSPIEGIVIKPVDEETGHMGRMVFKWMNDKYWLNKGNSDWH